ncbi:MAG: peptidoglycan-binding protein [Frankiaceae bacterium]|nr:peptidoglycan-binding protein [Frankiaceae bacterium]MBV9368649.1 peptidoglycan-binding protein [Frankiales bacterium]
MTAAVATHGSEATTSTTYTHGYDVSWPQCSDSGNGSKAAHMPSSSGTYVILGLTHGAGHTVNPCLGAQLQWAKDHNVMVGAYLVPSYPTARELARADSGPYGNCGTNDVACRAGNDGSRQAREALNTMQAAGVPAPMVWVDVEFRHKYPWSKNQSVNARVVEGVIKRLQSSDVAVGIYTTSYMWQHIVGDYRVNLPNWLPAGDGKVADAEAKCKTTGSGGVTWIGQYTRSFDENVTCPVMDATPGHPGPLWPYRNTTLTFGASGAAVTALQKALAITNVTGQYDAETTVAVVHWQQAKGLPIDGIIDTDDWQALGAFKLVGGHPFLLPQVVAPVS